MISVMAMLPLSAMAQTGGWGDSQLVWRLERIDGVPFAAEATITFPNPGRLQGKAPCNSFSAPLTAPYPNFAPGPIIATRRACDALALESAFFETLAEMTEGELGRDRLILTGGGRTMVFQRD